MTTKARSRDGVEFELPQDAIDGLKSRVRGQLLLPADAGYDESRSVWNGMIDRRPALVLRCAGVADVVAGVQFARERELMLTMKGGGHNISGLAVADGALMLDLSPLRGVWVDPGRRTARAQAGCLLGDVDRETQLHGLAAVLGFISNTGIAGLTLGGGFGYLTRRFGWTSDSVVSIELVAADGSLVRANESKNSDLFWGLRGGGGNFGVATSFEYQLFPVGPEVVAGAVMWSADRAPEVLELFRTLAADAPSELACVAMVRLAPPAPWIDPALHGKPVVGIAACFSGPVDEGEKITAAIKGFGKPVGDILQRRTYVSQQSLLDATQPRGRRYYWKSEYLPGLESDLMGRVIEHSKRIVSPHSAILLFPLGGALNRLPANHSAVGNRDAQWVFNVAASWEKPTDDAVNIEWARTAWDDLKRFSTGGTYVNFLNAEETGDRVRAAYGENYARLIEVKSRWDPENLFRANKNVAPAVARA